MRIEKSTQASQVSSTQAARSAAGSSQPEKPVTAVRRADSVKISDAGRALAQATEPVVRDADAELTAEQIAEIRTRIASGAYDSLEVVDAVARRILASGDLASPPPSATEEE